MLGCARERDDGRAEVDRVDGEKVIGRGGDSSGRRRWRRRAVDDGQARAVAVDEDFGRGRGGPRIAGDGGYAAMTDGVAAERLEGHWDDGELWNHLRSLD